MKVLYECCCGLDIHKKSIVACLHTPEGKEIQTFGTMTDEILALSDWLTTHKCTHVAMESTGSFWKPIYNVLEWEEMEVLVVNAKHIKNVPGRKTDVKDAEWIADLLQHGLLRGSYIPDRNQRELRELVRYRRSLIEERAREVQRMQKVLEGANIKLSAVVSDIMGVSGRAMIKKLIAGQEDSEMLAQLAKGRMRNKTDELKRSLKGLMGPHQKMMLAEQFRHIEYLEGIIEKLDREVKERMRPFERELEAIDKVPGIGRRNSEQILAEIGINMDRFPTDAHISSWAGIAPGNNESAGKRKSGKTPKGNRKLYSCLVEAGRSAAKSKDSYLSAQYHRIAKRRGGNRAAVAVGHSILVIIYHILKDGTSYQDLGPDYFEKRRETANVNRAIRQLEKFGYKVEIEKKSA